MVISNSFPFGRAPGDPELVDRPELGAVGPPTVYRFDVAALHLLLVTKSY
jgi:hypothetical protein